MNNLLLRMACTYVLLITSSVFSRSWFAVANAAEEFVYVCRDAGAGGFQAFPDVCRLRDGRLVCVFYAGYAHVSMPDARWPKGGRICYATSDDEGRSWSKAEPLFDGPDDDRDPSIAQLNDGRLICNFFRLRAAPGKYRDRIGLGTWLTFSDDLGKTWSPPRPIHESYYCSSPVRELADGRLIVGLYRASATEAAGAAAFSDDGGATWSEPIDIPADLRLDAETDLIQLKDGSLWAALRCNDKTVPMHFATSSDRSATWSKARPLGFAGQAPYLLRVALDGPVLLGYRGFNEAGKSFTALRYSFDECATWSEPITVDATHPTAGAYPSMVNLKDGTVLIVYYEEGVGSAIRAKRFRPSREGIEWLAPYDGTEKQPKAQPAEAAKRTLSLTLIPPSPVTDMIDLDIRAAVWNHGDEDEHFEVAFYLDRESPDNLLHRETAAVAAGTAAGIFHRCPTKGMSGNHHILCIAKSGTRTFRIQQPLAVMHTGTRSTNRLGGAWVDLLHHNASTGQPFDAELAKMTDEQWRELVRAMHAVDQNIMVITFTVRNYTHVGKHNIESEGYHGQAYYPSKLFSGRAPIASKDPLKVIFSEADRLGMQVMPGVGCYAMFDFTPASLEWHKKAAKELWEMYGHHPSFYGWYVAAEIAGNLGADDRRRREIVDFFREFRPYVRALAPDKPVMLASNPFRIEQAGGYYEKLLPHLDILCPFGFHRMPPGDLTGEEAAALLQKLCDDSDCRLWMDMESFVHRDGKKQYPRPIEGLLDDLRRFTNFEKILHYQFPGMMSSPAMSRQPGGPASVKLYLDYQRWLNTINGDQPGLTRASSH